MYFTEYEQLISVFFFINKLVLLGCERARVLYAYFSGDYFGAPLVNVYSKLCTQTHTTLLLFFLPLAKKKTLFFLSALLFLLRLLYINF